VSFAQDWWYWLLLPTATSVIALLWMRDNVRRVDHLLGWRDQVRLAIPDGLVLRRGTQRRKVSASDLRFPYSISDPVKWFRVRGPKQKGALMGGLYDAPIYKDWLAYWTGLALITGIDPRFLESVHSYESFIGFLFVLSIYAPLQFLVFGFVPTAVRRWLRGRRARKIANTSSSTKDPSRDPA
jgi:hypothetical protein